MQLEGVKPVLQLEDVTPIIRLEDVEASLEVSHHVELLERFVDAAMPAGLFDMSDFAAAITNTNFYS